MAEIMFKLADTDEEINNIAVLANEIWNEHFVPIIGQDQVDYMVEKFQSCKAMKEQVANGYEYYQILETGKLIGYTGIHQEEGKLFLSKLYLHKASRGKHIATQAISFLARLCKERGLRSIYLTCNKYNSNTIAVYEHLGFENTDSVVTDIGNGFVMDDYIFTYYI